MADVTDIWRYVPGGGPRRGGTRRPKRPARITGGATRASASARGGIGAIRAASGAIGRTLGPKFLPYVGWATVIGASMWDIWQRQVGDQYRAEATEKDKDQRPSWERQRDTDIYWQRELQRERDRQNARDVAAAYSRGLIEAQLASARVPPQTVAAAATPPAPIGNIGTVTLPPPTLKTKLKNAYAKAIASPLFLPTFGIVLSSLLTRGGGKSKAAPLEFIGDPPLTEFQDYGLTSGDLGGVPIDATMLDEELGLETGTASDACEKIDPKREPGQCRQGWFSETPKKLYLKEWSRRPCQ